MQKSYNPRTPLIEPPKTCWEYYDPRDSYTPPEKIVFLPKVFMDSICEK